MIDLNHSKKLGFNLGERSNSPEPIPPPPSDVKLIYRIIPRSDLVPTRQTGFVPKGFVDKRDGFVHMSTMDTVIETANLYFKVKDQPVVLEIQVDRLE